MKIVLLIVVLFLLICLIVIAYLLISPIWLIIDSRENKYWLGWNRWMNARFLEESTHWGIRIHLPFYTKRYEVEEMLLSKKKNLKRLDTKSKRTLNWRKAGNIWNKLKIREFRLVVDTHDVVLNAYLLPVFEVLSVGIRKPIHINFIGQNELYLKANIRMINFLNAGFL